MAHKKPNVDSLSVITPVDEVGNGLVGHTDDNSLGFVIGQASVEKKPLHDIYVMCRQFRQTC